MSENVIYTIGIGNSKDQLTQQAKYIISKVDVLAGHYGFIEMVKEYINPEAEIIDDRESRKKSNTFEFYQQNRVSAVVSEVLKGKTVAVLSGGDSGVWGMAGVFLEAQKVFKNKFKVKVIPGVPSFVTIASKLGAPLQNGFSLISVCDEDTPFNIIEKRLEGVGFGGGVIVLYKLILENLKYPQYYPKDRYPDLFPPKEKTFYRLKRTYDILSKYIPEERVMAIVTDVNDQTSNYSKVTDMLGSKNSKENILITNFGNFLNHVNEYRFFTSIIIGDENTKFYNDVIYTPQWNYKWSYDERMLDDIKDLDYLKEYSDFFNIK
ncbi:SAM-dependent methyltransferase [Oceanotoga sp. DSM 15011]|uniref:SAM-dependent methyltransferase n=1 Tax=Oceanotoga sp. DSM 15011 TaxID=2984951 RepID=UPI0021F4BB09|nr:SAM-dependent methyltransferase [Oceanotoga sp. DSM 15011]UYO99184.1 SAM-dependent methyltransferase [Oceanotoga sp. DSM 15011]